VIWPAIPLFWIPIHCAPRFFRRLGIFTYILPLVTWLPAAFTVFLARDILLTYRIAFPLAVSIAGILLFLAGAALQVWTLLLLTLPGITGMPEVTSLVRSKLVARGPFTVIRHPTYLSHTMMLLGLFLWTEITALGIVTAVDALVVNLIVIPLEERELLARFGAQYEAYRRNVPSRFFPFRRRR
jgi:protein-S-isoprenylcysteine O-methyltransferase Ste14